MNETNNTPAIIKPSVSELYRALKMAADISAKVVFHTYRLDDLKNGKELDDYEWERLFGDLLSCEAHLELAKKFFEIARTEIQKGMAVDLFKQFK